MRVIFTPHLFFAYRTFLLSPPGVVTMTFSGVIIMAPLAVAAPWNMLSTMALKVSTSGPSVTYSVVPCICDRALPSFCRKKALHG